jgi:hypothetical protein
MYLRLWSVAIFTATAVSSVSLARESEKVRNDKVTVWEDDLGAGEAVPASDGKPALLLYLSEGTLDVIAQGGTQAKVEAKPGKVRFEPTGIREIRNSGSSPFGLLRVEFKNAGSPERWGRSGLSSHYKVLLENNFVRVYDISFRQTATSHNTLTRTALSSALQEPN